MFPDAKDLACAYFEKLQKTQERDEYIEAQIEEYKAVAVKRLYKFVDPSVAEAIAGTIAFAYDNGLEQASEIVKKLALNDKHIAALNNDSETMCKLILEDLEDLDYYENYGE